MTQPSFIDQQDPKVKYSERACLIRCDLEPRKKLNAMLVGNDFGADPINFHCVDCFTKWDASDFSGAHRPETVSCSGCYCSRVYITRVRVCTWVFSKTRHAVSGGSK